MRLIAFIFVAIYGASLLTVGLLVAWAWLCERRTETWPERFQRELARWDGRLPRSMVRQ